MIITIEQIKQIIAAGGCLTIDAKIWTLSQIKDLANEVSKTNVTMTIKNVQNIIPEQLKQIALIAPNQIIFDFT